MDHLTPNIWLYDVFMMVETAAFWPLMASVGKGRYGGRVGSFWGAGRKIRCRILRIAKLHSPTGVNKFFAFEPHNAQAVLPSAAHLPVGCTLRVCVTVG